MEFVLYEQFNTKSTSRDRAVGLLGGGKNYGTQSYIE